MNGDIYLAQGLSSTAQVENWHICNILDFSFSLNNDVGPACYDSLVVAAIDWTGRCTCDRIPKKQSRATDTASTTTHAHTTSHCTGGRCRRCSIHNKEKASQEENKKPNKQYTPHINATPQPNKHTPHYTRFFTYTHYILSQLKYNTSNNTAILQHTNAFV